MPIPARSLLTLATAASLLIAPTALPPAGAATPDSARTGTSRGTLVFIKAHNVWLSRGDGSHARRLTRDGSFATPYVAPSQSDTGIIVAGRLAEIVRMDQSGRVLNRMDPPSLPSSVGSPINGNIRDLAISPNGALVAYTYTEWLSPSGASSGFRSATGYTSATHLTDPKPRGTTYFNAPSWVGNARTLQGGGLGSHVMIDDLGRARPKHWFDDGDIYAASTDLGQPELSPDGRHLAALRGYNEGTSIIWYRVNGNARRGAAPADPTPLCEVIAPGVSHPTWAPDSDSLAWAESDGIWSRSDAEDCSVPSRRIVPGGSEPDWSGAPLKAPVDRIHNVKRPVVSGTARLGKVLTSSAGRWSPRSVRVTYRWLRNGKAIKGADGRRHRVTRADRGRRIQVVVTARKSGWKRDSATSRPVRIKR
ncbi:hypothetical protein [Nocardioides sp. URHA0020]|uniref:hypothetical protein n=1 Tax=Nocardioides sp. URHA0020 TaxID=1380392 RepID=UPI000490B796|nr:hypothetical protein [Nocardioides sp. URHA0020]